MGLLTTEGKEEVSKGDGGSSSGKGRGWIPSVFIQLEKEAAEKILPNGGKVICCTNGRVGHLMPMVYGSHDYVFVTFCCGFESIGGG